MTHAGQARRDSRALSTPLHSLHGETRTSESHGPSPLETFGRINRSDVTDRPRFEFRKRGSVEAKPRSYRELVADSQLEIEQDTAERTRVAAERAWAIDPRDWPAERPRRDAAGAEARRAQLAESWRRLRSLIDAELTDFTVHCWIDPCELVDAAGDVLFVAAPGHVRGWVRERYDALFRHAARELAGRELRIVFVAPYDQSPCAPIGAAA